jgi:hypothetical protein
MTILDETRLDDASADSLIAEDDVVLARVSASGRDRCLWTGQRNEPAGLAIASRQRGFNQDFGF